MNSSKKSSHTGVRAIALPAVGLLLLSLPRLAISATASAEAPHGLTRASATSACSTSETWQLSEGIFPAQPGQTAAETHEQWRAEFAADINHHSSAVRSFAQALALRKKSDSPASKLLAEYWIAHSLLDARFDHVAFSGFSTVAFYNPQSSTTGIQLAALDCLNQIVARHPTLSLPNAPLERLSELLSAANTEDEKRIVWESLAQHTRELIAAGGSETSKQMPKVLALLHDGGKFEALSRGIWAASQSHHGETIVQLEAFVDATQGTVPARMQRYQDNAHVLLSRAYYSTKKFDLSAAHLKKVSKSSNELANALQELSWAYLVSDKQSEAIGTAMNLDAGGLRHTFAPEAPMVMAMALNELCQFPQSLQAVQAFRSAYEPSYHWLESWHGTALYPAALRYLRKEKTPEGTVVVPGRIASEWVRSPLFLSHQEEINRLFDERDAASPLAQAGAREQKQSAQEIRKLARDLKERIRAARKKLKPGEPSAIANLSPEIRADFVKFRRMLVDHQRLGEGAYVWKPILARFQKNSTSTQKQLVAHINSDLTSRTEQMRVQLAEIAENNQLIEVEIYNGASQDIIWQNAHPDYKKLAKQFQNERDEHGRAPAEKVWDWGKTPTAVVGNGKEGTAGEGRAREIWEDELGSFKVNLYDNCSSKDRYLSIKRRS